MRIRCLAAAAMTAALAHGARTALRNLWRVIPDGDFSAIFRQIREAEMALPWFGWIALALICLACVGCWRKRWYRVMTAVMIAVAGFLAALMMTAVNGVLFGDVVRTLVPLLMSGAL